MNDTHRRRQHKTGDGNRQAHPGQGTAQRRADAGIHQHLLEHPARTDHQQDNACRLQRMTADLHHPVFRHALAHRQAVNGHQARHQDRRERVADKFKPFVRRGAFRHKARGNGFQPHQHQRQQDQREAEAERRHFALAQMRLGDVVRNMKLNVTADEIAP